MGTRNLTIVHKNGEYKVAQYGQWDGYPEGLGISLLTFLKNINMDSFRNAIDKVAFYTKEELEEIDKKINDAKKEIPNFNWQKIFPQLSRDTGGDILNLILFKGYDKVENRIKFAANSLFCEWAYVIDLDKNKFEVYEGFNKTPLNESDRFFWLEEFAENSYHPVKLVKAYDIDDLPDKETFIADLTLDEEE